MVGALLSFVPLSGPLGALGEIAYMGALAWCGVALWRSVVRLDLARIRRSSKRSPDGATRGQPREAPAQDGVSAPGLGR